jgi:hypothetical protein
VFGGYFVNHSNWDWSGEGFGGKSGAEKLLELSPVKPWWFGCESLGCLGKG